MRLKDRVSILEGLVARLLREIEEQRDTPMPRDSLWPTPTTPPPAYLPDGVYGPRSSPPSTPEPEELPAGIPQPYPDWLPVYHEQGPMACHQPGVYLTQRVSAVHRADPSVVRILPRITDPGNGLSLMEPFREPRSDDMVQCAGCGYLLDLWSNADLDYRPWLDNEIGQPVYPSLTQRSLIPQHISRATAQAEALDARLATLKAQAESLHRNGRPGT